MSAPTVVDDCLLSECSHFTHQFARQKVIETVMVLVQWLSDNAGDSSLDRAQELLEEALDARASAHQLFNVYQSVQAGAGASPAPEVGSDS